MPFGVPSQQSPYSAGFVDLPHPMAQAVAPKPKVNWLGVLADALAGAAGREGPYASMLMQQRQSQQEEDRYQRHRADSFDLWRQQQDYQAQHPNPPQPTEYERMLQAAGYAPGTPEYVDHVRNYVNMKENPPYYFTDPTTGQLKMVPRNAGGAAPQGVTFTPIDEGGPSPSGSGGFR
jgi:hypothetical protein